MLEIFLLKTEEMEQSLQLVTMVHLTGAATLKNRNFLQLHFQIASVSTKNYLDLVLVWIVVLVLKQLLFKVHTWPQFPILSTVRFARVTAVLVKRKLMHLMTELLRIEHSISLEAFPSWKLFKDKNLAKPKRIPKADHKKQAFVKLTTLKVELNPCNHLLLALAQLLKL